MTRQPVFCIIDPSLKDFVGHHFSYDEAVARGATAAGYRAVTLAHSEVSDAIAGTTEVLRCFRRDMWGSHPLSNHVPVRFRTAFDVTMTNRDFLADLRTGLKRVPLPAGSILFAHMIFRNQLNALADFVADEPVGGPRQVILLLRYQPAFYDNPISARAFRKLERAAAAGHRVRLASDSVRLAAELGALTSLPFEVMPIPHTAEEHMVSAPRAAGTPLKFVSLGNARDEKGFVEILSAIRLLRDSGELDGLEFQLQANDAAPDVQAAIDAFAAECPPQVTLLPRALSPEEYNAMLLGSDVVLVPYWREIYRARTSGVFLESVAAGKIVVATSDTWMSDELAQYGAGVLVDDHQPTAIVEAIRGIRRNRAALAEKAEAGRAAVLARHNPDALVRQVVEGPPRSEAADRGARRVALFYPWGNFLERQSGAAVRCNLLVEKLAERAEVRVLQDGSWGVQRPRLGQLCLKILAHPLVLIGRLLSTRPGPLPRAAPKMLRQRVTVEAISPRIRQHLLRRLLQLLFRVLTPRSFGQEMVLWFFIERRLDPNFKARAAELVRWADVIVVEYPFWTSLIAPLCRAEGKRLIVSNHDVLSQQVTGSGLLHRLIARLEVEGLSRGDAAVTVSETDRDWYSARGVPSLVVPNPIDYDRLASHPGSDPRALLSGLYDLELPPGQVCLFVGSRYQSNIAAADRMRSLATACPKVGFVVVGDCAVPGRNGNFIALGRVDDAALALLYHLSALVLVPLDSGTGSSVKTVEAMSAGKVVLGTATAFRGLEPMPPGSLVQEDDFGHWPALIAGLLADQAQVVAMGEAARQAVRRYDYRQVFEPYIGLLGLQDAPVQAQPRPVRHALTRSLLAIALERKRLDIAALLLGTAGPSFTELIEDVPPGTLSTILAVMPLYQALKLLDAMIAADDPLAESLLERLVLRADAAGEPALAESFLARLEALEGKNPDLARRHALRLALERRDYDVARGLLRG